MMVPTTPKACACTALQRFFFLERLLPDLPRSRSPFCRFPSLRRRGGGGLSRLALGLRSHSRASVHREGRCWRSSSAWSCLVSTPQPEHELQIPGTSSTAHQILPIYTLLALPSVSSSAAPCISCLEKLI